MGIAVLRGQSGKPYHFHIFSVDDDLKNVGGVYALTKRIRKNDGEHFYRIYFFGHTSKLAETTAKHRKNPQVAKYDCDCVFIHLEENGKQRKEKYEDIRQNYNPEEEIIEQELK